MKRQPAGEYAARKRKTASKQKATKPGLMESGEGLQDRDKALWETLGGEDLEEDELADCQKIFENVRQAALRRAAQGIQTLYQADAARYEAVGFSMPEGEQRAYRRAIMLLRVAAGEQVEIPR